MTQHGATAALLRVGIVGFGSVARHHVEAYRGLSGIEIVGVADSDPVRQTEARHIFGLPTYLTLDELLEKAKADMVCVLTPPASHEQIVVRCAAARVHVLCEKPLALSVAACERMIAACRDNSVRLGYGASYRYLPALSLARAMIQRGDLGRILVLRESALGGQGPEHRGTLSYDHYPKGGPGGSGMGLCDHGIHLIDIFGWLMDSEVTKSSGRGNVSGEPQNSEFLLLEYANGAIAQLLYEDGTYSTDLPHEGTFAWAAPWSVGGEGADSRPGGWQSHPGCIHVHGTRGALRIFHYANTMFLTDDRGTRQVAIPGQPFPANFSAQLAAFAEAIRNDRPAPVPGEAGLQACHVLLSAYPATIRG